MVVMSHDERAAHGSTVTSIPYRRAWRLPWNESPALRSMQPHPHPSWRFPMSKKLAHEASKPLQPRPDRPVAVEVATPPAGPFGFFRFHLVSTEVSLQGQRTRVTSRTVRLEDGKLSTESFDGELPGAAYDRAVRQAQQQLLAQTAWLLRPLSWLLPPSRK
jgi:hypothetical protein